MGFGLIARRRVIGMVLVVVVAGLATCVLPLTAQASGSTLPLAPLLQDGQPSPGSLPPTITVAPDSSGMAPAAAAACGIDPGDQWIDSGTVFEYWALVYCTRQMPVIQVTVCYQYFTPGHAGVAGKWSGLEGCKTKAVAFTKSVQATGTVEYEFVGDPYRDYGSGLVTPPAGYYCTPSCQLGAYGPEI